MAACAGAGIRASGRRQAYGDHQPVPGRPAARARRVAQPRTVSDVGGQGRSDSGNGKRRSGLLFGIGAYASWGLFPAFFPLLKPAGSFEVLAHRIVWCFALMVVVIAAVRRFGDIRAMSGRTWLMLTFASALISVNWVIFIYAVNNGHVVDAALGYFINPLVTVALGVLIFRERLNRAQFAALAIAVVAVVVLTVEVGSPPVIGLGLAVSFGLY